MLEGFRVVPYIIIDENGEIKEEIYSSRVVGLNDGDRIVRKNSIDHFRRKKEEEEKKPCEDFNDKEYINVVSDTFTKIGIEELRCVLKELDVFEKAFVFGCVPYVGYEDCKIKYGNGIALNMKDFTRISGISERKLFDVISSLIEKHLLYKRKEKNKISYYINPWIVFRGIKLDSSLKDMFGEYEIRCKNMTKWKDL